MALNQREKELLAVVKYYNNNKKNVTRLVAKLARDFDLSSVSDLTGFTVNEIGDSLDATPIRKPRKSKGTVTLAEAEAILGVEPEPTGNRRLAIHLNAESDLAQRVAHDMATYISQHMKSGDAWLSRKGAMEKFECKSATLTIANGILLKHNWIEKAVPGNFRKGYVVK